MGQILTAVKPLNRSHLRAIAKCPLNRSLTVYSSATSESPPISIWLHREQLVWGYRKKSPKVASRFYICSVGKSFSAAAVYSRRRLGRQVREAILQFQEHGINSPLTRWLELFLGNPAFNSSTKFGSCCVNGLPGAICPRQWRATKWSIKITFLFLFTDLSFFVVLK